MVFAVWIAGPNVSKEIIVELDAAFKLGIDFIRSAESGIEAWKKKYLMNNISYNLDQKKKEAMQLFLQYADRLVTIG